MIPKIMHKAFEQAYANRTALQAAEDSFEKARSHMQIAFGSTKDPAIKELILGIHQHFTSTAHVLLGIHAAVAKLERK